ncbi:YncE family protein [Tunicatimonas pelagia]|uniref:YncE family protein n=1 Tax=Tunicatimonas pelagia TaxID=931531 RepID=UPI002666CFA1|nr:YncE family protein [Tunicatimonas pelagia]WKN42643.1 YncE family protein [Tunicatimonas pelagia]
MYRNLRHIATFFVFTLFTSTVFTSCNNDDDSPAPPPPGQDGYFIVNEGAFGGANTTLSYYDRQKDSVLNNVFSSTNNRPLGDQTQSMAVFDDRGFIVVQNSAKIEVIDRETFESLATIGADEGIVSPRYFLGISPTKGYVTDWGADGVSGTIKVLDLTSYQVTATVPIGSGPNELVLVDNQVYVANGGGFGTDSTVVVLDPQTDTVVDTIVVGENPSSLVADTNGSIWVASNQFGSLPGYLARLENNEVASRIEASEMGGDPISVRINPAGQQLYFRYRGGVYTMSIESTELPDSPFIDQDVYGLGVDPISGDILTGQVPNFSSDGTFFRYSTTGNLIQSYGVGIAPNGFAF